MYHRAGAHWLPHARAHEPVICDWDVQTYDYWLEMIQQEDEEPKLPSSGIKVCWHLWPLPNDLLISRS